ncbi:protein DEK-like [Stylophora pistillata]|uniref:Protein DEK n=1 Tax=Stylophora pistillata TaxID=50429 RepID=A0A2B4SGE8_STYPI|nr:protein DEK-like [Stylophora pistillata]PFX27900.1 Protein DEK [Stylophora pistillata]
MADKLESSELKSEAKEKDEKSNNVEAEDSKQDSNNGEGEDDEESSGEKERAGLFDKPVVIEGKRARKSTEFLLNQTAPTIIKENKPLILEGKGESLGSIERTKYELGRSSVGELKPLHKLFYGREGRVTEVKRNVRKFNGFAFQKDSKEYEAKKLGVERFTNDGLKRLCEIFDVDKKGKRSDLVEKVMDFLMSPKSSEKSAPEPEAKKDEKKKRKRPEKEGSSKSKKEKSKKTSETVESEDGEENEDDDEEEEHEEEPPKKKKKVDSTPKKTESSSKKTKETKPKGKEKEKSKDKDKAKSKKSGEKTKASKKRDPVPVKITALQKSPSKKKTPKKEKPAPVYDSSSDEEPLAKKSKKQPPTESELEKIVKDLLDGADLEKVTMKSVCKQVYDKFPEHDLTSRKDFIKETVRKVIS